MGRRELILAVDGSENSLYAVDWSLDNFFQREDHVTVLYVFPEFVELQCDEDGLCVPLEGVSEKTRQVRYVHDVAPSEDGSLACVPLPAPWRSMVSMISASPHARDCALPALALP